MMWRSSRSGGLSRWLLLGVGLSIAMSSGCVTVRTTAPPQPRMPETTVYFYPSRGQSAYEQGRDKYECNAWAVEQSGFDPSAPGTPPHLRVAAAAGPPPGSGVVAGAVTGAVVGAAVSHPWEAGEGAILGAMAGAVIGGAAESAARSSAEASARSAANEARGALLEQKAWDFRRAMSACLEGRGYTVR